MTATSPVTLWNRSFVIWWLGSAQSAFGTALSGIATSFLILHQTGSAGQMGVNLALALLPGLLSPLFGTVVDQLPLRVPLMVGNVLRGVIQLGVGIAALRGAVPLEIIYAASFLTGLVGAFYGPAAMGVTPRLVPPGQLQRATGLMQGGTQTMQLVGMVGGGVLVGTLGSAPALVVDGACFLIFAALLLLVTLPARAGVTASERFWPAFRAGLTYARRSPLILGLPVLTFLLNASFAPMDVLLPGHMEGLGEGAAGFGLFFGLLLGGLAVGSLGLAALGSRVDVRRLSVAGLVGMGVTILGLSATQTAGQMYVLAPLLGLANAATNVSIGVIFQRRIASEFYGRVGSLMTMVGMAGMPLVLLALAPVADRVTLGTVFGVSGVVTVLAAGAWAALLRRDPLPAPEVSAQSAPV